MTETQQTEAPESTSQGAATVAEEQATPTTEQSSISVTSEPAEEQQAAEPDVEAPAAPDAETTEAADPEGAPESYEPFSTPEGVDSLDEDVLATFGETARELNLSQDKAQALINNVAPKIQARQAEALEAQAQTWANEIASDPDLGGEKLDESISLARKAYRMAASPKLQELLKQTKLDVHPEVVRMFRYFGSRLSEDKVVDGGEPSTERVEGDVFSNPSVHAARLYKKHLS